VPAKPVEPVKPVESAVAEAIAKGAERSQQTAEQRALEATFDATIPAHTDLLTRANKFRDDQAVQNQRAAFLNFHTSFNDFNAKITMMEAAQYQKQQLVEARAAEIASEAAAVRARMLVSAQTTFRKTLDAHAWQRFLMRIYGGVPAMFALVCIAFALVMFVLLAAGMLTVDFGAAPAWMKLPIKIVYCPLKAVTNAITGGDGACGV
jgi:hypothetical protein